jgi:hypothetical protein
MAKPTKKPAAKPIVKPSEVANFKEMVALNMKHLKAISADKTQNMEKMKAAFQDSILSTHAAGITDSTMTEAEALEYVKNEIEKTFQK